jgi:hypothetical protein
MSKGPGILTRRKAVLLGALVLVLAAVTVALVALHLGPESHHLVIQTIESKGVDYDCISNFGVRNGSTQSAAADAIFIKITFALGLLHENPSGISSKDDDATVREISLALVWETARPIYWKKALNLLNQAFGRPLMPDDDLSQRTIAKSDQLFIRITPQGQFYVSTAEDRQHMIHANLLNDDPNLVANAAKICQDHWADWEKKVDDDLAKASALHKGKR